MALFRHILAFTVLPLLIFSVSYSYYRFIHEKHYLVGYDATCDPITESCYVWCEDDACEEPEYYAVAEKYASTLFAQCGEDITDCEAAATCAPNEEFCSITYCDPDSGEECDTVIAEEPEPSAEEAVGEEDVEMNTDVEANQAETGLPQEPL
jgi:hypothetical protein